MNLMDKGNKAVCCSRQGCPGSGGWGGREAGGIMLVVVVVLPPCLQECCREGDGVGLNGAYRVWVLLCTLQTGRGVNKLKYLVPNM